MVHVSLCGNWQDVLGWLRLLEQEKVPYRYTEDVRDLSEVNILVGIPPDVVKISQNRSYIFEPSLLSLSEAFSLGIVKEIFDEDNDVIRLHTLGELMKTNEPKIGHFKLHEMYYDYKYPVATKSEKCFQFFVNLSSQLFLQGVGFKEVPFLHDEYMEVLTTLIDKEKILRFMRKILIKAFEMVNLPYIHLWYYPKNAESVFLFRQDVDYVDREGVDNLLSVCHHYNIRGTYFINISGEEEFEDEIGHLKLEEPETPKRLPCLKKIKDAGHEIANHGYWHYVFENYEENYINIKKCNNSLEKLLNINAKGFSAPGGTWHYDLAKAIEKNKFIYASNACLDLGGFPYYFYVQGRKSKTLEIPFSSVCLSFLNNEEIEIDKFVRYYLEYIDEQLKNNEPITILGHPHLMGRVAKRLLPPVFDRIVELGIPNMTLGEFADWWKKRENLSFSYEIKGKRTEIVSDISDFQVEVIYSKRRQLKRSTEILL
ncbi:MAG: polysaccharide deacetylase family protein [Theionarchaea archaeon]|nr:polysaccharide deacetylase family protein [Theionarchaea archaeon]